MPRSLDRRILKLTFLIFLPLAFILNFMAFRVYMSEKSSRFRTIEAVEMEYIESRKTAIKERLSSLGSDLAFLSSLDEVRRFFEHSSIESRQAVESIFLNFSKSRGSYDQIRLIGLDGLELVRVDSRPLAVHVVSLDGLQNKSGRYYFKDVMKTSPGDIYMSPMDLNVEHGEVEIPYVPMVRLGVKVIDRLGGAIGLLFLNCYGDALFPGIYEEQRGEFHFFIALNNSGYYFRGFSAEDEWGFMFEDKKEFTMAVKAPDVWSRVKKSRTGQFYRSSGFYSFAAVSPLEILGSDTSDESRRWTLLSFIPSEKGILSFEKLALFYLLLAAGTTVLLFLLVFWGVKIFERERNEALVDPLTSLWNRRSFLERIQRMEGRMGPGAQACVALIDLGNFKSVNDICGHHAGDEALVLTARALLSELRTTDFVGRYGGDEFVVLFPDLDLEEARNAMLRLAERVNCIQIPSCKEASVIADWGLVHYPSESSSIQAALELADARMYENKRKRKEVSREG